MGRPGHADSDADVAGFLILDPVSCGGHSFDAGECCQWSWVSGTTCQIELNVRQTIERGDGRLREGRWRGLGCTDRVQLPALVRVYLLLAI